MEDLKWFENTIDGYRVTFVVGLWGRPAYYGIENVLQELFNIGVSGSHEDYTAMYELSDGTKANLKVYQKMAELNGMHLQRIPDRNLRDFEVVLLPEIRIPEYFFVSETGKVIYVSADKYRYSYKSFKLFIGFGQKLKNIPIKDVGRMRDGGTTHIITEFGEMLYVPTPFDQTKTATFTNSIGFKTSLKRMDLSDFDIMESGDNVLFTPKEELK
jgi:hypothetical protein